MVKGSRPHVILDASLAGPLVVSFPGWIINDDNGIITVDDDSKLDAIFTISNADFFQEAAKAHYAYADAGSLFWTGDFEIRHRVKITYPPTTATIDTNTGLTEDLTAPNQWSVLNKDVLKTTSFQVANVISATNAAEIYNGNVNSLTGGFGMGNQSGVDMYVKFWRTGSNYGIDTYINDPTFTDPADDSASEALDGAVLPYQYLWAFNSVPAGGNGTFQGEFQILSITPSPF